MSDWVSVLYLIDAMEYEWMSDWVGVLYAIGSSKYEIMRLE